MQIAPVALIPTAPATTPMAPPPAKPDPALGTLRTALFQLTRTNALAAKAIDAIKALAFDETKPAQASFDAIFGAYRAQATALDGSLDAALAAIRTIADPKLKGELLRNRHWVGAGKALRAGTLELSKVPITKAGFPTAQQFAIRALESALASSTAYVRATRLTLKPGSTPPPPA
jgi:hypothetical protein